MNKISVKGVVVGGVTDIVATVIFTLPLIVYLIATELTGTLKDPLQAAVVAAIRANPLLYGLQSLIGLACSVLGGYVAARVAKHDELLNGLLASFLLSRSESIHCPPARAQGPCSCQFCCLLPARYVAGLVGTLDSFRSAEVLYIRNFMTSVSVKMRYSNAQETPCKKLAMVSWTLSKSSPSGPRSISCQRSSQAQTARRVGDHTSCFFVVKRA